MNGTKNTETYQVSYTVTEADHEAGKYTLVPVGDVIVLTVERETTVTETVVGVERDGSAYVEPEKEEKATKKSKKSEEVVA